MKILPYDSFTINTQASIPQLIQTLQAYTERRRWFYAWGNPKEFGGEINELGFRISPTHTRFVRPLAQGRFESHSAGTMVKVRISFPPLLLLFMITGFLLYSAIAPFLFSEVSFSGPGLLVIFGFVLMQGLVLWMTIVTVFWHDARRVRRLLEYWLTHAADTTIPEAHPTTIELSKRRGLVGKVMTLAIVIFVIGFTARLIQSRHPINWLEGVIAIMGGLYILLAMAARLYVSFPLTNEIKDRRLRILAAIPAFLLVGALAVAVVLLGLWVLLGGLP